MERKTIIIIIIVVVLCTSLSLFFYLRNVSNKSKTSDDNMETAREAVAASEAMLKTQAKELFMKEELKDIDMEIISRKEIIKIQGNSILDETTPDSDNMKLSRLIEFRANLYKDAETLFELIYTSPDLTEQISKAEDELFEDLTNFQEQGNLAAIEDLQEELNNNTSLIDENVLQQMSPAQLVATTTTTIEEIREHIPQENENPSSKYINLRRKLQQLVREKTRRGELNYGGGFPDHWTPRPSIETKDIVRFPSEWGFMYGISGSSTIRNWISSNLERDEASGTIGPSPTNI